MFSPPRIKFAHAGSPYLPRPIQVKRRVKEIHEIRAISSWIKLNVVLIWIAAWIISLNIRIGFHCNRGTHTSYYITPTIINPLHTNISMHFLHTVLYTFPQVLTRRISLKIKFLKLAIVCFILVTWMFDPGVMLWGELTLRSQRVED